MLCSRIQMIDDQLITSFLFKCKRIMMLYRYRRCYRDFGQRMERRGEEIEHVEAQGKREPGTEKPIGVVIPYSLSLMTGSKGSVQSTTVLM